MMRGKTSQVVTTPESTSEAFSVSEAEKRMQPTLSIERDSELTHHLLISRNEMLNNPAFGVEHREFLERVVEKVLRLPPCQQRVP